MMVIGLILTLNIHLTVLIQKGRISALNKYTRHYNVKRVNHL